MDAVIFQELKKTPVPEILVVYDPSANHGTNFIVCITQVYILKQGPFHDIQILNIQKINRKSIKTINEIYQILSHLLSFDIPRFESILKLLHFERAKNPVLFWSTAVRFET